MSQTPELLLKDIWNLNSNTLLIKKESGLSLVQYDNFLDLLKGQLQLDYWPYPNYRKAEPYTEMSKALGQINSRVYGSVMSPFYPRQCIGDRLLKEPDHVELADAIAYSQSLLSLLSDERVRTS